MNKGTKLSDFLEGTCSVEMTRLLISMAEGCKVISQLINNAGLTDIMGAHNSTNVHGEEVQKLDDLTNKILMDYLRVSETCAGYLSEENEHITTFNLNGRYTVAVDPLDGSSNIDIAAPIGTIFCVNERLSAPGNEVVGADFLQKGTSAR